MLVEKQSGSALKIVRSDGGGEYTSLEFQKYCDDEGIVRDHCPLYPSIQWDCGKEK